MATTRTRGPDARNVIAVTKLSLRDAEELARVAKADGRARSAVLRDALQRYLASRGEAPSAA